jgi:hypothetical protein
VNQAVNQSRQAACTRTQGAHQFRNDRSALTRMKQIVEASCWHTRQATATMTKKTLPKTLRRSTDDEHAKEAGNCQSVTFTNGIQKIAPAEVGVASMEVIITGTSEAGNRAPTHRY